MKNKIPPTPWSFRNGSVFNADGEPLFFDTLDDTAVEHIIQCVNACSGIEPDKIGQVIATAKAAITLEQCIENYTSFMKEKEKFGLVERLKSVSADASPKGCDMASHATVDDPRCGPEPADDTEFGAYIFTDKENEIE